MPQLIFPCLKTISLVWIVCSQRVKGYLTIVRSEEPTSELQRCIEWIKDFWWKEFCWFYGSMAQCQLVTITLDEFL